MPKDYEEIALRHWNLSSKPREEEEREILFMDDIIQKAHLEREIIRNLEGVRTVFDGGAGTGRFSIFLARLGVQVIHFDISRSMLDSAREKAVEAGVLDRMDFVQGRLTELEAYRDGQFDMVISFDAPVSYTYPRQHEVLSELVRIARSKVIVSVASRLGWLPYLFNPAQKQQYVIPDDVDERAWYAPPSPEMMDKWVPDFNKYRRQLTTGITEDPDQVLDEMVQGGSPWPITYGFLPDELESSLQQAGLKNIRLAGPGALSRSIPRLILKKLLLTEYREEFLQTCYEFDSSPWVSGLGKDTIVACGTKEQR